MTNLFSISVGDEQGSLLVVADSQATRGRHKEAYQKIYPVGGRRIIALSGKSPRFLPVLKAARAPGISNLYSLALAAHIAIAKEGKHVHAIVAGNDPQGTPLAYLIHPEKDIETIARTARGPYHPGGGTRHLVQNAIHAWQVSVAAGRAPDPARIPHFLSEAFELSYHLGRAGDATLFANNELQYAIFSQGQMRLLFPPNVDARNYPQDADIDRPLMDEVYAMLHQDVRGVALGNEGYSSESISTGIDAIVRGGVMPLLEYKAGWRMHDLARDLTRLDASLRARTDGK